MKRQTARLLIEFARSMGTRYVGFRVLHEAARRTGILKRRFPTDPPFRHFVSKENWNASEVEFFFRSREDATVVVRESADLAERVRRQREGEFQFFSGDWLEVPEEARWTTNVVTGKTYDSTKHWTEIRDFDPEYGDIKYVWELSRFSHLYDFVRHDYHFGGDSGSLVFDEIKSWIAANPINRGPNYRCSQEISLRILNWTFALYYYRDSAALTAELFDDIINSIYWQARHVRANIHFSRIAVRNNHAITETLTLYLIGLLYPFFPEAVEWKKVGRRWFEEEIAYQVYEDGSYLQFSMNYQRVVVQLLTWAIHLSRANGEEFDRIVYDRAESAVDFLFQCQDAFTGWLPNYGNNDGALFFKLSSCHYRDFRPQLNALWRALRGDHLYETGPWREESEWYGDVGGTLASVASTPLVRRSVSTFPSGGYITVRDDSTLTFLRCGNHRDRPHQADNLHLDIWYNGENVIRDAGTYRYNGSPEIVNYFGSTAAHNTVQLGDLDQMMRGPRFMWGYWTQLDQLSVTESDESVSIVASANVYRHIDPNIIHTRTVRKPHLKPTWSIVDSVKHKTGLPIKQIWNLPIEPQATVSIVAKDASGSPIEPVTGRSIYSSLYGQRENGVALIFETSSNIIETTISIG